MRLGLIYEVVSDLLRLELEKEGIDREDIGWFKNSLIETIVYDGVLKFH